MISFFNRTHRIRDDLCTRSRTVPAVRTNSQERDNDGACTLKTKTKKTFLLIFSRLKHSHAVFIDDFVFEKRAIALKTQNGFLEMSSKKYYTHTVTISQSVWYVHKNDVVLFLVASTRSIRLGRRTFGDVFFVFGSVRFERKRRSEFDDGPAVVRRRKWIDRALALDTFFGYAVVRDQKFRPRSNADVRGSGRRTVWRRRRRRRRRRRGCTGFTNEWKIGSLLRRGPRTTFKANISLLNLMNIQYRIGGSPADERFPTLISNTVSRAPHVAADG